MRIPPVAAMRCKQTCIPQVYGTAIKDGKVCIVMKLYRESLQGLLKRQGGKLPLSEVHTHTHNFILAPLSHPLSPSLSLSISFSLSIQVNITLPAKAFGEKGRRRWVGQGRGVLGGRSAEQVGGRSLCGCVYRR